MRLPASPPHPEAGLLRLSALLMMMAVPALLASTLALLGLGVLRAAHPTLVSAAALVLIVLPVLGVSSFFRARALGLALGLFLWPPALLVGLPLYFPGERGEALAAGLGVMTAALGLPIEPALALAVDRRLPGVQSRPPLPTAAPEAEPVVPPPHALDEDEVVLPYEGEGRSLFVPLSLEGPAGAEEVWMIFDTGASFTTANAATLAALGVRVPEDAPELTVQTANGDRITRLALIDRVWIGGLPVEGVTVGLCEECAHDRSVGLLGLNVSGRFLVTVDQARHELVLKRRSGLDNRALDIAPWVDVSAVATRFGDGRAEVKVTMTNRAPRAARELVATITCGEAYEARLARLGAGQQGEVTVALPVTARCLGYTVALGSATW